MLPLALAHTPLHSKDVGTARLCAGLCVRRASTGTIISGSHWVHQSVLLSYIVLSYIVLSPSPSSSLLLVIVVADFDLSSLSPYSLMSLLLSNVIVDLQDYCPQAGSLCGVSSGCRCCRLSYDV